MIKVPRVCLQIYFESWCVCVSSCLWEVGDKKKYVRSETCLQGFWSYWRDATWIREGVLRLLHKEMVWHGRKSTTNRETRALDWVYGQLSLLFRGPLSSRISVILLSALMVSCLMISLEQRFLQLVKNKVKGTQFLRSFWFVRFTLPREVTREQGSFSLILTATIVSRILKTQTNIY